MQTNLPKRSLDAGSAVFYRVHHKTSYSYSFPVPLSFHQICLKPKSENLYQEIGDFEISIVPDSRDFAERTDFFGNYAHTFSVQDYHSSLEVESRFRALVFPKPHPTEELTISCHQVRNALHGETSFQMLQALQFIYPSPMIPHSPTISEWATQFFKKNRPFIECVLELNEALHQMIEFDPDATEVNTSVEDFFQIKKGVCQDYAHLMISCLRSQDLPAKYVSGYILTMPPEGQPRLLGADASHAWVSVFVPGYGWIDVDPTNNLLVNNQHIRVAVGRDFSDISMIKGTVIGGGDSKINVEVTVAPEEPVQDQYQTQS